MTTGPSIPPVGPTASSQVWTPPEHSSTPASSGDLSPVDRVLSSMSLRGITGFFVPNAVDDVAKMLEFASRVMLLTGFNVGRHEDGRPMPETDALPGVAYLANALTRLGKHVTIVTDSVNHPIMVQTYGEIDPGAQQGVRFVQFDVPRTDPRVSELAIKTLYEHRPDVVGAIELPSRTATGSPMNMRGVKIGEDAQGTINPGLDELLIAHRNMHKPTFGIGDGGNEAGLGQLAHLVPTALNGEPMAAAVRSDRAVTSWNSMLGAIALGLKMLALSGRIKEAPSGQVLERMIIKCLEAGAVDGVTRLSTPGARSENGFVTGVDGFPPSVHAGDVEMLKVIMEQTTEPKQPVLAILDSSLGGAVAGNSLSTYLPELFPHGVRIIAGLSNTTVGDLSQAQVAEVAHKIMATLLQARPDAIALACNTFCTALSQALVGLDADIPVIDLIETTANGIIRDGGSHPCILSTKLTAEADNSYLARVHDKTQGAIVPDIIACHEWAGEVNALKHLSKDPAERAEMETSVRRYVNQIPEHATSVWLCCTHYPALERLIRQALDERGMSHVPVINPMAYQAAEASFALMKSDRPQDDRIRSMTPLVITNAPLTGRNSWADRIDTLFGRETIQLHVEEFGGPHDAELMGEQLFKSVRAERAGESAS